MPAAPFDAGGGDLGRTRILLHGSVQGVGFRPFVFRLATELGLRGWVSNSAQGVCIEIEGPAASREAFRARLEPERPPPSRIHSLESLELDAVGYRSFEIRPSAATGPRTALVLPDLATCSACLRELFDPSDRRHRYPFVNCTHCGPRFTIIEALPYDRPHTSMRGFRMCAACQAEYDNPHDRRFHAQPNACPDCGPQLALWDDGGTTLARRDDALQQAGQALRAGRILAVKGLGGFHLMVRAADEAAVRRLRKRKHREEKPLALMAPSLEAIRQICAVSPPEARLLGSPEAPIVILRRLAGIAAEQDRPIRPLAPSVAPGNPNLGVMLPSTPLHHLLLDDLGEMVVATSGNLSDEPICTDEREALARLGQVADLYLVHDRPIVRHVDDSIVRIAQGRELMLRRARGFAPLPVWVTQQVPSTLAVGAHLKNSVALGRGREIFVSQHIGDLETAGALKAFRQVISDLGQLLDMKPERVMTDGHPDYLSSRHAKEFGLPVVCVQHHYAHVLACMADNDLAAPLLGVAWDGTGYGTDETIWGGEFLRITPEAVERVGHLRLFRLPGGDAAVKEPRRAALGLLFAMMGDQVTSRRDLAPLQTFAPAEIKTLMRMLARGVNSPLTSSAGRLFDAVASLTALRHRARFEGQAAMDLEFAFDPGDSEDAYPVKLDAIRFDARHDGQTLPPCPIHSACHAFRCPKVTQVLDWGPMIAGILEDLSSAVPVWEISAKFHNTLVEGLVAVARQVGERRVALTGGCFQNKYLLERSVDALRGAGFSPYWHQRVPPNDGGIALGQVFAASRLAPEKSARH
jgi:hydrogenase maturation protein HypF